MNNRKLSPLSAHSFDGEKITKIFKLWEMPSQYLFFTFSHYTKRRYENANRSSSALLLPLSQLPNLHYHWSYAYPCTHDKDQENLGSVKHVIEGQYHKPFGERVHRQKLKAIHVLCIYTLAVAMDPTSRITMTDLYAGLNKSISPVFTTKGNMST